MFSRFQRKGAPRKGAPRVAKVQLVLDRLVEHFRRTGYFMGAMGTDMPRRMTPDGLEMSCDPALLIGVTAAPSVFGIECANLPARDLADSVATILSPAARPEWMPDLATDGGMVTSLPLMQGLVLRLTCLPCPVDPCFNDVRQQGARLIGRVQRT